MPTLPDPIEVQRTTTPPPPPSPPPKIVGWEERYEVEQIIDSMIRGRRLQYLIG
jgi:hypothetical protein